MRLNKAPNIIQMFMNTQQAMGSQHPTFYAR